MSELLLLIIIITGANLAFQVGAVSNETVKYGREFCGTSTQE
jgi:hypothetical protein